MKVERVENKHCRLQHNGVHNNLLHCQLMQLFNKNVLSFKVYSVSLKVSISVICNNASCPFTVKCLAVILLLMVLFLLRLASEGVRSILPSKWQGHSQGIRGQAWGCVSLSDILLLVEVKYDVVTQLLYTEMLQEDHSKERFL